MNPADDIVSSPPVPHSRKRSSPEDESPGKKPLNLKGSQFIMPTPPDTDQSSDVSPRAMAPVERTRSASPAPSTSTLSEVPSTAPAGSASGGGSMKVTASGTDDRPAKRRKLTPAEKLVKQQEQEAKDREKAEKKARREEEKSRSDEIKRAKAEEKDAKKREKEHAEELKHQEKLKKERAQMRLGAFFQLKPSTPNKNGDGAEGQQDTARRRSLSLEGFDSMADQTRPSPSPTKQVPTQPQPEASEPKPAVISDYHKTFLSFELPSHTAISSSRLGLSADDVALAVFDSQLNDTSLREKFDLGIVPSYAASEHHLERQPQAWRGLHHQSVEQLARVIEGSAMAPIDLTKDASRDPPLAQLREIPVKHIHFWEDVRPAYQGTYTKIQSARACTKLRRNPLTRARPDTNYDYDSEVEWEEPEEGDEEIGSDDDDESDKEGDADEIAAFLDDSDDTAKIKSKAVTAELVPEVTGLCWADKSNQLLPVSSASPAMRGTRLCFLIPGFTGSTIDPFSTEYWKTENHGAASSATGIDVPGAPLGSMAPPRAPLQPRPNSTTPPEQRLIGAAFGEKLAPLTTVPAKGAKRGRKPTPNTLNKEDLEEFKQAVIGSPLGRLDLQKALKIRFPKMKNETIKETLATQFAQVGMARADKKWVFVGTT